MSIWFRSHVPALIILQTFVTVKEHTKGRRSLPKRHRFVHFEPEKNFVFETVISVTWNIVNSLYDAKAAPKLVSIPAYRFNVPDSIRDFWFPSIPNLT